VTLSDVARRAGVSRTTASFVITGRRDMGISADATQRVLQAAHELSYRPNLLARGLRTNLTHTIGLVSDTIATTPYAGEVIRGAVTAALLHEHLLFIGETEGDAAVEKPVIQGMLDRGVDGFVYAAMYTREAKPPAALRGHPTVLLNCVTKDRTTAAVVPDEAEAGATAVGALLAAGHDDGIVLVGETPHRVIAARERLAGITEALSGRRLRLAGAIECLWWPESAFEAVRRFLATGDRATALICLNDRVAMGAYQAIQEAGRRIPDDLSIVSFDDSDLATWLRPQLTSVAIPHFELGRRAVELLLSDPRPTGAERIPMPLRQRASIGPPRAGR
jgi:LacI family transcriptional regulator, galactose operon repressor